MKKFLKRISLFAAIVIVIFAVGEVIARNMKDSYSYKGDYMRGHGEDVSTLVLGTSHAYYGIKSGLLGDSVFNLANVSQTPDMDLELLEYFEPQLRNLKNVVTTISYFTFVDPRFEDGSEWYRGIRYKVSMGLPIHSDLSKYNFEISDFQGYTAKLKSLVVKEESNRCDSLGWGLGYSLDKRDKDWESMGEWRAGHTTLPLGPRAGEVEAVIGSLIEYCRARGVDVTIVTTPVWHTYYEHLDPAQLSDMQTRARRIAERYNVTYYDLMTDTTFVADDFYDVDHLSDRGAAKFTRILREKLSRRR